MPPALALLLWLILLLCIFRSGLLGGERVSASLWVPLVWTLLLGSRSVSQWLGAATSASVTTALEEGNTLDHVVYLTLILLALRILVVRQFDWRNVAVLNLSLTLFLVFSLLSVTWSDFPLPSLRRWVRELGSYLMVLVVLSEPDPLKAIDALLRRFSYILISMSVVLIKYFREVGVTHSVWTGEPEFLGVTTSKNMLGAVCLISGLFYFSDLLKRWPDRRVARVKGLLLLDVLFMGMTLWLLTLSRSATSQLCLVIGGLVLTIGQHSPGRFQRHLRVIIPTGVCTGFILAFSFDISNLVAEFFGRDSTLTGRTDIWAALLGAGTNPLFGSGFASFWLGDRLLSIWSTLNLVGLNEAHNGYLETYLELGVIGVSFLASFLLASYRTISQRLTVSSRFASFGLALWTVILVYNVAESAFRNSILWFAFLLIGIAIPRVWHKSGSIAGGPARRPAFRAAAL